MNRLVLLLLGACSGAPESRLPLSFPGDRALPWRTVGTSVEGRPIYAVEFGSGSETTLIFAGFHGNERTAVEVALTLCGELPWHTPLLEGRRVVVVPILNPDGYEKGQRANASGIDLNRNFPTENWRRHARYGSESASEPETRTVMDLVEALRPAKILSLHDPMRVNNYDGPQSRNLAEVMAQFNGYPVKDSIGYPTPGSFGTWAGVERGIAMVTLEIPNGDASLRWRENRWALIAAIRHVVDKSTRE